MTSLCRQEDVEANTEKMMTGKKRGALFVSGYLEETFIQLSY